MCGPASSSVADGEVFSLHISQLMALVADGTAEAEVFAKAMALRCQSIEQLLKEFPVSPE